MDENTPTGAKPFLKFCKHNGFGKTFGYNEIKTGQLIAIKAGRKTLITNAEEQRYLATRPKFHPRTTSGRR